MRAANKRSRRPCRGCGDGSTSQRGPGTPSTHLEREFAATRSTVQQAAISGTFRVESLYTRTEYISGTPLRDGYHFAQTQINDFGRPYGEGWNTATGFSVYANEGRWVGYFRGELQTAGGLPALPLAARETIQQVDHGFLPPATAQGSTAQLALLDAYVGLMFSNWQVSFGRQSLWWGPGDGGPMMLSDNAAPLNMFRINRVTPIEVAQRAGLVGAPAAGILPGSTDGTAVHERERRHRKLYAHASSAAHDSRREIHLQADGQF